MALRAVVTRHVRDGPPPRYPTCAGEEQAARLDPAAIGLAAHLPRSIHTAPAIVEGVRSRVAILREQGVNGQIEMAAAFTRAGFDAVDIHMLMTDPIIAGSYRTCARRRRVWRPRSATCSVRPGVASGVDVSLRLPRRCAGDRRNAQRTEYLQYPGVCNSCQMIAELAPQLVPRWRQAGRGSCRTAAIASRRAR